MQEPDEILMKRCLQLSLKGKGNVAPNPMVGCVITVEDPSTPLGERIIGEGYHARYGEAHAEVNAINSVNDKSLLPKSKVYVNLEPCSHHGKTPPCARMLIEHEVKEVLIGTVDSFDQVAGKGIALLKSSGINVRHGILEEECRFLNRRFFTSIERKRPYIILKFARTRDGFIARKDFTSKWISNPFARMLVHKFRSEENAIMTGTTTTIVDNPSLDVRHWHGNHPARVIIDKNLKIPRSHNIFNSKVKTLVYNFMNSDESGNIKFIKISESDTMIEKIMHSLFEEKFQSLLVEGGSTLLSSFIDAGLWDEARVFTSHEEFTQGIKAPVLTGSKVFEEKLFNNNYEIFLNPLSLAGGIKIEHQMPGNLF